MKKVCVCTVFLSAKLVDTFASKFWRDISLNCVVFSITPQPCMLLLNGQASVFVVCETQHALC